MSIAGIPSPVGAQLVADLNAACNGIGAVSDAGRDGRPDEVDAADPRPTDLSVEDMGRAYPASARG